MAPRDLAGRIQTMKTTRRWPAWCLAGLGLALTALTGCQTNIAGMTLPSGRYLEHPPQFIPESPPFPLSRELANQEAISVAPAPGCATPSTPR
jgi:hypothetical protein